MANALSTDLYEVTMMAGYHAAGLVAPATFELSVREPPPARNFLMAAGLEQALDYLEGLRFEPGQIEALRRLPDLAGVAPDFFDRFLPGFRFTGDVWAVEEGTPVFAAEPLLRVTAPIIEAQLVETALLAIVGHQTSIASKAARSVLVAEGRPVLEFGTRRAHGTEAAMLAARAAYLAGCAATSNVEAAVRFGIPVSGTMAHSWVMAHRDEAEAFRAFSRVFGDRSVLLIDTYDTVRAAREIVAAGLRPAGVRIDSGDLAGLSRAVRQVLDDGGCRGTKILVSGDLDEDRIAVLLSGGAPVDGFGVGTAISVSRDAPALGGVYKLVEVERDGVRVPTMKLSRAKRSWPGPKQVWRVRSADGVPLGDVIAREDEVSPPSSEPLLSLVMRGGRRVAARPALEELRRRSADRVAELPGALRGLAPARFPVRVSDGLEELASQVAQTLDGREPREVH